MIAGRITCRRERCDSAASKRSWSEFFARLAKTAVFQSLLAVMISGASSDLAHAKIDYSRPVNAAPKQEDIGKSYQVPAVQRIPPRSIWIYGLDVLLLSVGLVVAAFIAHRWRRRWMAVAMSIFSIAYFGFYRQGCVCPVGSVQNVTASLVDSTLAVPLVVLLFFLLPLIAALLVGRVFCGGLCPLGAIQDIVVLKPVQLPPAVDRWGGKLKYVYLALAIWFAAQSAETRDFVICRFDPFIGFFRLNGTAWLLSVGGGLLLIGTVVGRPYCRFLCPYGGLLAIVARFAFRPVQITPDEELDCGLCAESCPFGAVKNLRADRMTCLACTRCFAHCPRQQYLWGDIDLIEVDQLVSAHREKTLATSKPVAIATT